MDQNILNTQVSNYSIASTDCGKTIQAGTGSTGQFTLTLPSVTGFPTTCSVLIKNSDTANGKILSGFPSDLYTMLWPDQSVGVKIVNGAWATFYNPGRWQIPANVLFYVNGMGSGGIVCGPTGGSTCSAGSDSNDCLSAATPCNTVNNAKLYAYSNLSWNGFTVFINIAHGTTANNSLNCAQGSGQGNSTFYLEGDSTAPTAAVIQAPNTAGASAVMVGDLCTPSIQSLKIVDNASTNAAALINVTKEGQADSRGVTLGTCNSSCVQVEAQGGGAVVNILGVDGGSNPNALVGGALQGYSATNLGSINFANQQITVASALSYSGQFAVLNNGGMMEGLSTSTWTGSGAAGTTGTRCSINAGGIFDAGAAQGNDPNAVFLGSVNCIPHNGWPEPWTPTLQGSSIAGSPTYTAQYGTIIINGTHVHVHFNVAVSALGSPSGNMQIGGLPVAVGSINSQGASDAAGCPLGPYAGWTGDSGFTSLTAQARGTATFLDLIENGTTKTGQFTPVTDFAATTSIVGSCDFQLSGSP